MKKFFITGTDTDIGKTFVSSLLFNNLNENTCYYKPIQTGCAFEKETLIIPDLDFVKNNSKFKKSENFYCSYPLKYSLSPHLSCKKTNTEINVSKIIKDYKNLENKFKNIIVEGAGGVFTPINENNYFIYNLIKDLNLNTIVVTSTKIGTINHTILTLNHLKQTGIKISGIVFNKFKNTYYEQDNINFIKNYSKITNTLILPVQEENSNLICNEVLNFINSI